MAQYVFIRECFKRAEGSKERLIKNNFIVGWLQNISLMIGKFFRKHPETDVSLILE